MLPFFRKKPKDKPEPPPPPRPEDRRGHYRVQRTNLQGMTARLLDSRGIGHPCEVLDLSLGGAAISFPAVKAPAICRGQEVTLEFQSMARERDVRGRARIVVVVADSQRVRCGIMFTETGALLEQLDAYHARLFNRRRYPRVLPDLRTRLALQLTWEGGSMEARAHDISAGGVGLGLSREAASELAGVEQIQVRFVIPGTKQEVEAAARVACLRALTRGVMVGLEFLDDGGIAPHRALLETFVEERINQISQWNAAAERKTG
ncbi:MAG: PilZ domain-containing protein [Planctomycetes bacterium]|nr:PilZ domain-containing protein [Planctomycetota bacterium]